MAFKIIIHCQEIAHGLSIATDIGDL